MVNDGKIPRGLLLEGRTSIRNALKQFELAKKLDAPNETWPGATRPKDSSGEEESKNQ